MTLEVLANSSYTMCNDSTGENRHLENCHLVRRVSYLNIQKPSWLLVLSCFLFFSPPLRVDGSVMFICVSVGSEYIRTRMLIQCGCGK